ncbi:MAG: cadmium resistance transporter [Sphaerospermopsis kisseleviana]|uniref:Cadmium resistance transporter n=3 Tax=Sphaerospermopsis TaxID=752201 RepID=A0A479ZYG4_9CYAN|nr:MULTISPECIES: cadmium resistance transporter [Sphaerospermopsis]BAZ81568.1 cadmium resistance transporter [Sphaerospermopsis kisseleviana NIES-73]MBD2133979.1 cadmium resistance transporter [Sphaerospermopsis sp. FACHB-1094]MBD2145924.1 cadmium resistance transporter [Sphaerospermopsis sp. FACHB-1194]MBE9235816.1 cadmium resistance transporter [Sphaerospermopsis aphanizomenoides LEGE 00250]MDB9442214.1 cadmium resistance transporter [Sphaerospermopsis kisseleviana CS-549]
MSGVITAISTGAAAFSATNIDDLVILTLFFSQVNVKFRKWHIILGQYAGFTALVLVSLPGFFGGLILPRPWIGLFGLIPIIIGIKTLLNSEDEESEDVDTNTETSHESLLAKFFNVQTYSVAAITFANGTDNISIYVPIFASSNWQSLLLILGVFFLSVGLLCYVAYKLTHNQAIAHLFTQYGHRFMPYVLIGLGTFVFIDSHSLSLMNVLNR